MYRKYKKIFIITYLELKYRHLLWSLLICFGDACGVVYEHAVVLQVNGRRLLLQSTLCVLGDLKKKQLS